jgi:hypothetical protein
MYVVSKLAIGRVLAVAFAIMLWSLSVPGLQAKPQSSPDNKGCGCPAPVVRQKPVPAQCCPAPSLQKPTVSAPCCPAPVVRQKPTCAVPVPTCCPVDPKDVRRAERAAEHAQHEAAEACKRQQRAAAKAQKRIDDAYAKGNRDIDRRTARLNQRNAEWAEANAKLDSLQPTEAVAAETPQPGPEQSVENAKPAPEVTETAPPAPAVSESAQATPEATPEPEPESSTTRIAILQVPAPAATPEPAEAPKELPRTAGSLGLIGLIGVVSMTGYLTRFFRR